MNIKKINTKELLVSVIFIITFISFLFKIFLIPYNHFLPIDFISGVCIITFIFISFFTSTPFSKFKNQNYKIFSIRSDFILLFMLIIMLLTEPIKLNSFLMISDWNQINPLRLAKALLNLLIILIIPGYSIYNFFFKNIDFDKKLKSDPIILKLTIYPSISLLYLGTITLILDRFKLDRPTISNIIIISIVIIYLGYLLKKKKLGELFRPKRVKFSKETIILLIILISVILIAYSITLSSLYLIPGDSWRGIGYAYYVGDPNTSLTDKFYGYTAYWGYISFALSILCGIPCVNVNVLLFPLVTLFITSIFLLIKELIDENYVKYSLIIICFIIIFAEMYNVFNPEFDIWNITSFTFNGIFIFYFRSYAYISLFIAMFFYVFLIKNYESLSNNHKWTLIFFIALFLIQCYITYFLPILHGIIFILIYSFIYKKNKAIEIFVKIFGITFLIYIIYDLCSYFYFSWIPINYISFFINLSLYFNDPLFANRIILNGISVHLVLLISLLCLIILLKLTKVKKKKLVKYNFAKNSVIRKIYLSFILLFTIGLILYVIYYLILDRIDNFILFSLEYIYNNIGIIGIISTYLSYFCFLKNRRLFLLLFSWITLIFFLSFMIIFINWINYPFSNPYNLTNDFSLMRYWFTRNWFYSIIPYSILGVYGFKELMIILNEKYNKIPSFSRIKSTLKILIVTLITFLSLSNLAISGVMWYNYRIFGYYFDDEEAQIIGWISENVPEGSNILIDRFILYHLDDLSFSSSFYINEVVKDSLNNQTYGELLLDIDENCEIRYFLENYSLNEYIKFIDNSSEGNCLEIVNFDSYQEYGYYEFCIQTSNSLKSFCLYTSSNDTPIITIRIYSSYLQYFNGQKYFNLIKIDNNRYYKLKVYFEFTDINHFGMEKNTWKLTINETEYGPYSIIDPTEKVNQVKLFTSTSDYNYYVIIDNFTISWSEDFSIEFNRTDAIFSYLKNNNINYLVLSNEINGYQIDTENYIDIYDNLIPNFFKEMIYSYQDLSIYYAN